VKQPARIAAIVPVAAIEGAKTRLGESLDAEERHDLVERLLARTLTTLLAVERIADVLVVSPDREILDLAAAAGARTLRQRSSGLNAGIREARDDATAGGAEAIVVIPIDLPFITTDAVDTLLSGLDGAVEAVILAPDRHGTGTNALAIRPPDRIDVAFGRDSRAAHRAAAAQAGAVYREIDGPLSVDLDTPEDLVFVEASGTERPGVG
jgi:2-phospho-L-lactate/phosphoenolpyruvate guanylyltransferase